MAEQQQPEQQEQPPPRRGKRRRRALRIVGAGLYQLTIRLAVNLATLALFIYFAVNSAAVAAHISAVASDHVPGTIIARHIQWGPDPGQLRLIRPVVSDAEGQIVLAAEWLGIKVSWLEMLQHALKGEGLREIRIPQITLAGPKVAIEEDGQGHLRIANAFAAPRAKPAEPKPKGAPLKLIIDSIKVQSGLFMMDLAGTRIKMAGVQMEGDFQIALGGEDAGRYSYSGRGVAAKRASMWLKSFETAGLAQLPVSALRVGRIVGDEHMVRCFGIGMTAV